MGLLAAVDRWAFAFRPCDVARSAGDLARPALFGLEHTRCDRESSPPRVDADGTILAVDLLAQGVAGRPVRRTASLRCRAPRYPD